MKTHKIQSIIVVAVTVASVVMLAGCASKGYDQGAGTATAMQTSADSVSETSGRVNDVLAALNSLAFKPQGDLRDQYAAFTAAVGKLNDATGKLDATVAAMKLKSAAYFENWSNQLASIQSPEIRQRSADRKAEVTGKVQAVDASYAGVKSSFKPFVSDVKDIQTYLNSDLTVAGLNNIKDIVARTKVDAVPLRDAVKKLQAKFSDLSAALSPTVPAADK